jgi:hypothetical protein
MVLNLHCGVGGHKIRIEVRGRGWVIMVPVSSHYTPRDPNWTYWPYMWFRTLPEACDEVRRVLG